MAGETVSFEAAAAQTSQSSGDARREQSTIVFPYLDLDAAVEVARAMHATSGHGVVEAHELAAQMGQAVSGAFRLKTGTARIFGLTEKDTREGIKLSSLGRAIIEPESEKAARAEAFMCVPLYAAIYDKYKGQRLPPMKALEREMQSLGVSSKQADKARQAFERSAKQAGYKEMGDDRLVRPRATLDDQGNRGGDSSDEAERREPPSGGGGGYGGSGSDGTITGKDHPLIQGMLMTLPKPGSEWAATERKAWLIMANSIFGMIYKATGDQPKPTASTESNDELLG